MKRTFYKVLAGSVLILCSCASSKTASVDASYVAKSGFIMAKPVVVDVKVEKRKITGSAVIKNSLYGKDAAQDAAKKLAVLDAIKKGEADIIIQPMYEIDTKNNITTATVSGFAGKYKEFRDLAVSDTLAFMTRANMDNSTLIVNADGPGELSVEKKKKGSAVLGVVGALLVVGLLLGLIL